MVPFAAIYVGSEIGIVPLDRPTLAVIAGALRIVDVALFFGSRDVPA